MLGSPESRGRKASVRDLPPGEAVLWPGTRPGPGQDAAAGLGVANLWALTLRSSILGVSVTSRDPLRWEFSGSWLEL